MNEGLDLNKATLRDVLKNTTSGNVSQILAKQASKNFQEALGQGETPIGQRLGAGLAGTAQTLSSGFHGLAAPFEAAGRNFAGGVADFSKGLFGDNSPVSTPPATTPKPAPQRASNAGVDQKTGENTQQQPQDLTSMDARARAGLSKEGVPQNRITTPEFNNANAPQIQWPAQQPIPQWVYDQQAREAEAQRKKDAAEANVQNRIDLESLNPGIRAAALASLKANNAIIASKGLSDIENANIGRQVSLNRLDQLNKMDLQKQQSQLESQRMASNPANQIQQLQLDAIKGLISANASGDKAKAEEHSNTLKALGGIFGKQEQKDEKLETVKFNFAGKNQEFKMNPSEVRYANDLYNSYANNPEIIKLQTVKDHNEKARLVNNFADIMSRDNEVKRYVAELVLSKLVPFE